MISYVGKLLGETCTKKGRRKQLKDSSQKEAIKKLKKMLLVLRREKGAENQS